MITCKKEKYKGIERRKSRDNYKGVDRRKNIISINSYRIKKTDNIIERIDKELLATIDNTSNILKLLNNMIKL